MTTFLLIRHGAHLLGGETIAGRMKGVHLSPLGQSQAVQLVERVGRLPIRAIYSSPMDRTQETARPLAEKLGLPIQVSDAVAEIDVGEWEGMKIAEIKARPLWKRWNAFRSGTRPPGGELMIETQWRIVNEMMRLVEKHPDECVAIFSHGDVIKAAVAYFAGVSIDLFQRIEISLASVTVIAIGEFGPWLLTINNTAEIAMPYR